MNQPAPNHASSVSSKADSVSSGRGYLIITAPPRGALCVVSSVVLYSPNAGMLFAELKTPCLHPSNNGRKLKVWGRQAAPELQLTVFRSALSDKQNLGLISAILPTALRCF